MGLSTDQTRENNFDFVRLAMALLVIFSHSFPLATGRQLGDAPDDVSLGKLAVGVFFTVSGYLIAMSWDRSQGLADFMRRRVLRIYPGFLVAFALSAWVVAPLVSKDGIAQLAPRGVAQRAVEGVLLHHVAAPGAFPRNPYPSVVNGSLWTIPYEFWCYVAVAGLGLTGLLRKRWLVLAAFAAAWGADVLVTRGIVRPTPHPAMDFVFGGMSAWPHFLAMFLAGSCLYAFRDRVRFDGRLAAVAALALVATLVTRRGSAYLWPAVIPYLTFWFAFAPGIRLHRTTSRLGGDYSYGIYLYAFPIQQLLVMWGMSGHPLLLFAVATPLTVVAAILSWRLVERTFLRRKSARVPESLPPRDLAAAP